jgi:glucose/arabinose dehydrogenase
MSAPRPRVAALVAAGALPIALVAAACGTREPPRRSPEASLGGAAAAARSFGLRVVVRGLVRPTHVSAAPGDARGLWVLEQPGRLLRVAGTRRRTVLDLRSRVSLGAERGLLGLAFHPGFARNRRLFVNFTDRRGDTRVVAFRLGPRGRAAAGSGRPLLHVRQPEDNHNGGALLFAPDGRLLVGMGDGGGAFDPRDRAQDPRSRLGKVLAGNVDRPGRVRWQTLLSGARNPWRMWADPALNEVWIGDVGQNRVEEIDRVLYEPEAPPKNLGWPAYEGHRRLPGRRLDRSGELIRPVATYSHADGCSVTGGLIYRGLALPALAERYVFGDFCSGRLWSVRPLPGGPATGLRRETARAPQLTHIGTDARGELVFAVGSGEVLRAVRPRRAP